MEQLQNFDFSAWQALAKSDPEKFEQARREALEQEIQDSGNDISRHRLKELDRLIENYRTTENNPDAVLGYLFSVINRELEVHLVGLYDHARAILRGQVHPSSESLKASVVDLPVQRKEIQPARD